MKKIDLKCDSCGAVMELDEDEKVAVCPFCKNKCYIDKDPDIEELAKNKEKLTYAEEMGRRKAIDHHTKKQNIKSFVVIIAVVIVLSIICIVSLSLYTASLELIENPYECINVSFVGDSGEGKIMIENNNKCDYYSDLEYKPSKENNLKENEKIKISVSGSGYRFGTNFKEYKVTGLNLYLTELTDLTDDMLKKVYSLSNNIIKKEAIGNYFTGKIKNITHYKLYLLTDNENVNYLFDVCKVSNLAGNGKTYTRFAVAYYESFILTQDEDLFKYKRLYYAGNIIKAGKDTYNSLDKGYIGNMVGFKTINEFESYLTRKYDSTLIKKVK